jgi:hypothetical protein
VTERLDLEKLRADIKRDGRIFVVQIIGAFAAGVSALAAVLGVLHWLGHW